MLGEFEGVQQEVWSAATSLLEAWLKGDTDEAYRWVHPDFVFWNNLTAIPGGSDEAYKLDTVNGEHGAKWLTIGFVPLTVHVDNDVAIVNAYIRGFQEDSQIGSPTYAEIRYHGTFRKHDGVWKQLANYLQNPLG